MVIEFLSFCFRYIIQSISLNLAEIQFTSALDLGVRFYEMADSKILKVSKVLNMEIEL